MIRKARAVWRGNCRAAHAGCFTFDGQTRATTSVMPGIAEIGAKVGAMIRQGRPLPIVLTTLCQFFDATVKGYFSCVLLLDCDGWKVRSAVGGALPPGYMKQLEGKRVKWIETPLGAKTHTKTPVIALDPALDALREGQEAAPAGAPCLRLHEFSPILSLTGEPLGIFAVYRRESSDSHTPRQRDAEDEGGLSRRPSEYGRETTPHIYPECPALLQPIRRCFRLRGCAL
jgi:hypothetical protein